MSSTSTDAKVKLKTKKEKKKNPGKSPTSLSVSYIQIKTLPTKENHQQWLGFFFSYILFKTIIYTIYSGIKYKFMYFDFLNGLVSYIVTTLLAIRLSAVNFMKLLSKM